AWGGAGAPAHRRPGRDPVGRIGPRGRRRRGSSPELATSRLGIPGACRSPSTPEAAADIGNPDADLDREGPREGLTDGDALAHLLLGQPLPLADHLAFHLADERDGAAEAEEAEAQIVPDELADGHAPWCLLSFQR